MTPRPSPTPVAPSTASGPRANRNSAQATSTSRSIDGALLRAPARRRAGGSCGLLAPLLAAASAGLADGVVDQLRERIQAAPLLVGGEAGRGHRAWDRSDPGPDHPFPAPPRGPRPQGALG